MPKKQKHVLFPEIVKSWSTHRTNYIEVNSINVLLILKKEC